MKGANEFVFLFQQYIPYWNAQYLTYSHARNWSKRTNGESADGGLSLFDYTFGDFECHPIGNDALLFGNDASITFL